MDQLQVETAVSVAQLSVVVANPDRNLERATEEIEMGPIHEQHMIVFPECFLTGYITNSYEETAGRSISIEHPVFTKLRNLSASSGAHLVMGFLEKQNEKLFNTSVLTQPSGELHFYRKQHLLKLGADAFTSPGGIQSAVVDLPFAQSGMMICYDLRFPEVARRLALEGAELITMPTNWPESASILADHFARVRAAENGVYLAIANRPDSESGMKFLGRSQVIDPNGNVLVDAGTEEGIFTTTVNLAKATQKQRVVSAGEYEYNLFSDRRPELYDRLSTLASR